MKGAPLFAALVAVCSTPAAAAASGELRLARAGGHPTAATAAGTLVAASDEAQGNEAELATAIQLFESFDDERAAAALHRLVERHPPSALAARAHVYLALIALNDVRPDAAHEEFKRALRTDPLIELPLGSSPKARLAFSEAQHDLRFEMQLGSPAAPAAASAISQPPVSRRHPSALAWTLIALGIAAEAVAAYGAYEVQSYHSLAGAPPGTISQTALKASFAGANAWKDVWIPVAVGGGLLGGGAAFAW
ncbi:MAG: tetratricopeptide repeat protein [Myxococcales bacterium]